MCIYIYIYTEPLFRYIYNINTHKATHTYTKTAHSSRVWHKINCQVAVNSWFFFSQTSFHIKDKETNLPYLFTQRDYLNFPNILALYELQTVSSRIWTRVAVSIFSINNRYTTFNSFSSFISFKNDFENSVFEDFKV